jgi:HEAT repeat protein
MPIDTQLLAILVGVLYAVSAGLIVVSLIRHRMTLRQEARHAALVKRLRGPVETCLLEGAPLPTLNEPERAALLDLSLRYTGLVRGEEADRLVACLEEQGVIDGLVAGLGGRNEWDRAQAAALLGRLRVTRAVPALVDVLDDQSEDVRTVAARSLAAIGDERAVPALAQALGDPSRWTLSLVAENLMLMGPKAVPPLLEFVRGDDHNVRVAAVQILGEIRDPAATPPICEVLREDPSLDLRARAAASLGQLGGPEAEEALLRALDDADWQVRAQAAKALGVLGDDAVAPALSRTMPDRNWWVRSNCAEALANLGAAGARELSRLQHDRDRYVRDAARATLELYGLASG